jgi:membrane fusion protein, copper/silver efflux system
LLVLYSQGTAALFDSNFLCGRLETGLDDADRAGVEFAPRSRPLGIRSRRRPRKTGLQRRYSRHPEKIIMAQPRARWIIGFTGLGVIAAIGSGLWYSKERGWLKPAEEWVRRTMDTGPAVRREAGSMGDMTGMGMGAMDDERPSPGVKGYAEVEVAADVQQRIGVTFGQVEKAPLKMSVRTVGIVRPDETRTFHIHVRTEGWVETLFVNFTGQKVEKGEPFLSIYSPEFYRTELDYVTARQVERAGAGVAKAERSLAGLAVMKLKLLDVSDQELHELERTGKPREFMTLRSPVSGTVLEKNVLGHEFITPQRDLYVVADLTRVWVQAKVYEYELPHIELGKPADVAIPSLPGQRFEGKVVFIQPTVEEATRTIQVRVELANPTGLLKPGMFADIIISHDMGAGLLVPTSAVIRTGERDIAFRAGTGNRFMPVQLQIGEVRFGDRFQVIDGLNEGDRVVTSANFLIDSESRLKEGAGGMGGMPGMDMGGMKGNAEKADMNGMDHSRMKH